MNTASLKKYLLQGVIILFAAGLLICPDRVKELFSGAAAAVSPFVTGIILATVIDPAVMKFERIFKGIKKEKLRRGTAIGTVYVIIAGVTVGIAFIIMPKLWSSAALFINSFDGYYSNFRRRYEASGASDILGIVPLADKLISLLSERLPQLFDRTWQMTAGFLGAAGSFLVGLVLSVYILAEKKRLTEFISAAAKALMSEENYNRAARTANAVGTCLVSFISGQLTEAAVLGTLCFIGMVIFGFEYPLLISTIIGVTALVPVAGAIVGAIPSALMLFLAKPSSALWFIIFIIILQQLENNLIYPRVVGRSVGLPPILILTSIILGAKLGGAAGIMLGIPIMSAFYMLMRERIESTRQNA